jgi:hypothetical protein
MTPVDSTGKFDFGDPNDRNFSLALLDLALTGRTMVWAGDSVTRGSFVAVICDIRRVFGTDAEGTLASASGCR